MNSNYNIGKFDIIIWLAIDVFFVYILLSEKSNDKSGKELQISDDGKMWSPLIIFKWELPK